MKDIIKNIILAGIFSVPFIIFIVAGSLYFPFITGKGFTFRILIDILFGLYIILTFLDPQYRPRLSWITKSILIFGGVILLADLLGENPYKSFWSNYERMEGFILIFHLILYYIVSSSVLRTSGLWNKFLNTSLFASAIVSIFGVFQLLGLATINQGGVRVDGTFGNAAYFAIYLVFHIFISLYLLVKADKNWLRWTYGSIALLQTIILYYTATRGAILGLLGGLFVTGVIIAWKERQNIFLRKSAIATVAGVLVVLFGFILIKDTSFVKNSPVLTRFSTISLTEFQSQGRYFVWPMAIEGFKERPILGWGQENFNFVFNKYYNPSMYGHEQWFDRTHNIFLDWLIAGGILGLLSYLGMFFAVLYYIWRSNLSVSEKGIFTGMIMAYVFHNIFVFDNLISYIMFFSILAYIHSTQVAYKENFSGFYTKTFSNEINNYVVIPVVTLGTIALVYYVNIPALNASRVLIQAITPTQISANERTYNEKNLELFEKVFAYNSFGSTEGVEQIVQNAIQINSLNIPNNIKQQYYNMAKEKILEKLEKTPNDARYLMFAGGFFNRFGQYDEAIKYLERALVASPKKQSIYFELATSYLGKGDTAKMFQIFEDAYELEPNAPESKVIYAIGAIYTNNKAILDKMSSQISEEILINDNRFISAYADVNNYGMVISILQKRIERDPTNKQHKLTLASTYMQIGQKQNAINIIQQMIKDDPSFKLEGEGYIKQIQEN